jgi:sugar/nucleoside kinase (ribokinase family)
MNLWIDIAHEELVKTIATVDCLVLNDAELKQLTDEPNLMRAAHAALELGPRAVIAKQGEYGSAMITRDGFFGLSAYPTADIVEPTGAGDSFAGGLMGYLASLGGDVDDAALRRAMAYGTACASFNVEGFGSERLYELDRAEIDARVDRLEASSRF